MAGKTEATTGFFSTHKEEEGRICGKNGIKHKKKQISTKQITSAIFRIPQPTDDTEGSNITINVLLILENAQVVFRKWEIHYCLFKTDYFQFDIYFLPVSLENNYGV